MKTKLTITHNGFHGYTIESIVLPGNPGDKVELSRSQIKKLARAACGMSDCRCGESILNSDIFEDSKPWERNSPIFITIPIESEIEISGNYPQR